jgi:hypothetical protein
MEQKELESLRPGVPRLEKRLDDFDKLNLRGLEHTSVRAREFLKIAAAFQVSGEAQKEMDSYRTVATYCDELERHANTSADFRKEMDRLLPD